MASNISGIDQFLRWTLKNPSACDALINIALDHIFNVLAYWVESFGAERIFAWMSSPCESNQLISPKIMEKFALPAHVIYHERLRALGIERFGFHICGDQNLNLPMLSEASPWRQPSVLSFGHEVDLDTAATFFPEDIIYGNVEPVVIQVGTPGQVYELSRDAIEKGKKAPGGFVLGPGCGLPVNSPPTNMYAMTKAINDFGWYD
jgi:uroporphyrinogen decarboxylase